MLTHVAGKTIAIAPAITAIFAVGCSTVDDDKERLGYEPKKRFPQKVQDEVGSLSSEVRNLSGAKGKTSGSDLYVGSCRRGEESGDLQWVRHPWSLIEITEGEMRNAMERLRRELPKNSWKTEKYGNDKSRNQNLEMLAVHVETRTQLEITALKGGDGKPPLLEVTLYSRCFKEQGNKSDSTE